MDQRLLTGTLAINEDNHLTMSGIDLTTIAEKYGTPTIVYDVEAIRNKIRAFKTTFNECGVSYDISYASKAFSCKAIFRLVQEEGLSIDVVSGGELFTALAANIDPNKIHFHGNNKTEAELKMAIDAGIGTLIIDNFYEISLLQNLLFDDQQLNVMFRTSPGIEAHTHDYIMTGQRDSKFGFDLENGDLNRAFEILREDPRFNILGVHAHLGSQIFETEAFQVLINTFSQLMTEWKQVYNYQLKVLNLGGGFGIRYVTEDDPLEPQAYVKMMVESLTNEMQKRDLLMPEIWIEPGRSIVGDAAITLYTTGSQKYIEGIRHYLSVDGGMTDNIRPALYGAKYSAVLADQVLSDDLESYALAGKCCESGDMLIEEVSLPRIDRPRVLAVFATGAYGYSMANNYNRIPRPLVLFIENGQVSVAVRRETYEDLIRLDN